MSSGIGNGLTTQCFTGGPRSVLQGWVMTLTMMQQSVLLSAIRGADGLAKRHVSKYVLRWLRRCILLSAMDRRVITSPYDEGGGNFTGPIKKGETVETTFAEYLQNVDEVPHHFHLHVVHAAEILGYKHPTSAIRLGWNMFYLALCRDMHVHPETEKEMDYRLGDSREQWQDAGGEVLDEGRQ